MGASENGWKLGGNVVIISSLKHSKVQCKLCLPTVKMLSSFKVSTSNLQKYLQVRPTANVIYTPTRRTPVMSITVALHQTHSVITYTRLQIELRRAWLMTFPMYHVHLIEIGQFDWLITLKCLSIKIRFYHSLTLLWTC